MLVGDWRRVIDQAAVLGVRMVQFIGGEPTLYPALGELIEHALALGVRVEVYSNLVHVPEGLWEVFGRPGVSLATSWYSDDPGEHARIVGRATYARTLVNVERALRCGIPLRAGVIGFDDRQRVGAAVEQLAGLGVGSVGVDHVRGVGRGAGGREPSVGALCGQCASGKLAVLPSGDVVPCVFARWEAMRVGNVLESPLADVLDGARLAGVLADLRAAFASRRVCDPNACSPDWWCKPEDDGCKPHPAQRTRHAIADGATIRSIETLMPPCSPDQSDSCNPEKCTPDIFGPGAPGTVTGGLAQCGPGDDCGPNHCIPDFKPPVGVHDPRAAVVRAATGNGRCGPDTNDGCLPDHCSPDFR
jgi:hypothetical protein